MSAGDTNGAPRQVRVRELTAAEQAYIDKITRHMRPCLRSLEPLDWGDQLVVLKECLVHVLARWLQRGDRVAALNTFVRQTEESLRKKI